MHKHRPTHSTQSDILDDPLDGYPDRKPFYTLAFLLLRRPDASAEEQAVSEPDRAYFYIPEDVKQQSR